MAIERIDAVDGRFYSYEGRKWPSVNTIIHKFEPTEHLHKWRAKVGAEEAARITAESTKNGTRVHRNNEAFFSADVEALPLDETQTKIAANFSGLLNAVVENVASEKAVHWTGQIDFKGLRATDGKCVGFGGTYDALNLMRKGSFLNKEGNPFFKEEGANDLILVMTDYKTKKRQSKVEWLIKYFIQVSAYIGAVNQMTNCELGVQHALISIATTKTIKHYLLEPHKVLFYWQKWMQMVAAYFYDTGFDWEAMIEESMGTFDPDKGYHTNSFLPRLVQIKEEDTKLSL